MTSFRKEVHSNGYTFEIEKINEEKIVVEKNMTTTLWIGGISLIGLFVTGFSKTPPEKSGVREIQEKLFNIETHDKRRENNLRDRAKLSIQSFDENILEIIKRKNLEVDYQRLLRDTHDAIGDEDEYEVELIFPLPGHTYKTFAKDIANLMDRPLAIPRVYYGLVT